MFFGGRDSGEGRIGRSGAVYVRLVESGGWSRFPSPSRRVGMYVESTCELAGGAEQWMFHCCLRCLRCGDIFAVHSDCMDMFADCACCEGPCGIVWLMGSHDGVGVATGEETRLDVGEREG